MRSSSSSGAGWPPGWRISLSRNGSGIGRAFDELSPNGSAPVPFVVTLRTGVPPAFARDTGEHAEEDPGVCRSRQVGIAGSLRASLRYQLPTFQGGTATFGECRSGMILGVAFR